MDDTDILLDNSTDANCVDIIHTNEGKDIAGNIGIFNATGHDDFYGLKFYKY